MTLKMQSKISIINMVINMNVLGPVKTSLTIGKSYIQMRDLIQISKKMKIETIILKEPHPKSWMGFIFLCKINNIRPIIIYEKNDKNYLLKNEKDIILAIRDYNNVYSINLEPINLSIPEIIYPCYELKNFFDDKENYSIEDYKKNYSQLKEISKIDINYNIEKINVGIPYIGNFEDLKKELSKNNLDENEIKILKEELKVIKELNVSNYILNVKKIIDIAKKNKISVGPGRGSAVSSYLVYKLGITKINPLKYDLLFERFLNIFRKELPDIDIDIDSTQRNYLITLLEKYYGKYKIAQIRTYSTMKFKSVLKKLKDNFEYIPYLKNPIRSSENYELYKKSDSKTKEILKIAYYFEGLETAESTHAAGIIISNKDLRGILPIDFKEFPIIEYQMEDLKKLNIEKFDILSLDTLNFLKMIQAKETFDELQNTYIYDGISKGLTKGIFQLESKLGRKVSLKIKPKKFEDLILLIAMNRPGPLESGMLDEYLDNSSPDFLKKIFPETNGVIVYQEQIMKLGQKIGGLDKNESDLLRKAVAKKDLHKLSPIKNKFIKNASQKIGEENSIRIFSKIEMFAQYAFAKSHASAYAHISYWIAEEKFKNPSKFVFNYIKLRGLNTDIINECSFLNTKIYNPSLKYPKGFYSQEYIFPPISCIKGIGKNIEELFSNYNIKNFEEFINICISKKITRNIIEILIRSGALDFININRKMFLRESTKLLRGELEELKEIESSVFGNTITEDTKEIKTTIEDLIIYETETIGLPLSQNKLNNLSNELHKKYLSNKTFNIIGYAYKNFIFDSSGIIYDKKIYHKVPTKIIKKI
ncbi:hypothetical protein M5Z94_02005 [Oceanotoga teriensis]|nr:hypothetical protein [Oceanotoga teriensis]